VRGVYVVRPISKRSTFLSSVRRHDALDVAAGCAALLMVLSGGHLPTPRKTWGSRMKRAVVGLAIVLASVTVAPEGVAVIAPTTPPPCGQAPSTTVGDAFRPAKATLALDGHSDELVTDATFGRKTGTRLLTLVYSVTGCEMADTEPEPQQPTGSNPRRPVTPSPPV
jgi:hypothetical protein